MRSSVWYERAVRPAGRSTAGGLRQDLPRGNVGALCRRCMWRCHAESGYVWAGKRSAEEAV